MKYRKKPVIIEALQWDGTLDSYNKIKDNFIELENANFVFNPKDMGPALWEIKTLEGKHKVSKWDWIIKGVKGEFYPCKPDVFQQTYEKVD